MGHIFAFMTADRVPADDGSGRDAAETVEHGWIDPPWSRFELHESRNYVRPVFDCDEKDEDLADYVRDILGDGSLFEGNGEGTFCGQQEEINPEDSSVWTYAVHFTRKHNGPHGWTEDPWHPVEDGRITLTP